MPVDLLYVGLVGVTLGLAGGRSHRLSWLTSGLITLWVAGDDTGRLIALGAITLAVWAVLTTRRRWTGAVIGALLAWVLGDLGGGPFHASTTLFAAIAALPMIWSAARRLPRGSGRVLGVAASAVASLIALATLVFGLATLFAAGDVATGIDHAEAGFDRASEGDEDAAAREFDQSSEAFSSARDKVSGFWTLPARLVPIVGQHARAVQVVASEGVSLTRTAADTARAVDPDNVRLLDGGIDLEVIDELAPVLARVESAIVRARDRVGDADSPWLVGPVASRLVELTDELDAAAPAARTASLAAAEAPTMLGAGEPVDWLILLTTPAEARGLGGLVGNFVVVRADDGSFSIIDAGRNEDLNRRLAEVDATLRGPEQYVARWGAYTPERFFQDVTLSPDLPSVAAVAADLYQQATDTTIEGVLVLDPYAVEAILELSGPVGAGDVRLSAGNVVQFLLVDQYDRFDGDELARVLALNELVTHTFDAFTGGSLPGPRGLAAQIGPVIEADRLGIWWAAGGGATDLLDAAGLDGRFPSSDSGDLFGVVHQNSGQNKIDVYLDRSIEYRVVIDDRRATATAAVELTNGAPADGLPLAVIGNNDQGFPLGTNVALISIHSALNITEVRVDGIVTPSRRSAAFGDEATTLTVEVPAATTVLVEVDMVGRLEPSADGLYRLEIPHQPLVNPDTLSVSVSIDGTTSSLLDGVVFSEDITLVFDPR